MKTRTVVLTSRENFRWLSMQEIIPLIEKNWQDSAVNRVHEVICHNVDNMTLSDLAPDLLTADNIVFTCFTTKLCRIGEWIRKDMTLDARFFIYLHNQATIYCWPLHVWGMGRYLREDDVFIGTSRADERALRHSLKNARFARVPFTLDGVMDKYSVASADKAEVPFVYVGRLSEQKNLHTLIQSFKIFTKANPTKRWKLLIYGKDDNLGSPNMGIGSKQYGKSLSKMTKQLGLEKQIVFKGFQKRETIDRALTRKKHIMVSASLHSDENFGMAPFRSLVKGNFAVLTKWGGFADFGQSFSRRVLLAPVNETANGPSIQPMEFARLLERAAKNYRQDKTTFARVPNMYSEKTISLRLREMAVEKNPPGPYLKMTSSAERVLIKRERFRKSGDLCRVFTSYADRDAKAMFRSYGMGL